MWQPDGRVAAVARVDWGCIETSTVRRTSGGRAEEGARKQVDLSPEIMFSGEKMFRKLTDGVFARRRWIYLTYPSQTETAEGVWREEALSEGKKKGKLLFSSSGKGYPKNLLHW